MKKIEGDDGEADLRLSSPPKDPLLQVGDVRRTH